MFFKRNTIKVSNLALNLSPTLKQSAAPRPSADTMFIFRHSHWLDLKKLALTFRLGFFSLVKGQDRQ